MKRIENLRMSFKEKAVQLSYDRHNISELALDYRTIEEFWKQKIILKMLLN
jgi:hypothetical protein